MLHRLEFGQWIPFPIERVFAFFSNAENLPRIHVGIQRYEVDRAQSHARADSASRGR